MRSAEFQRCRFYASLLYQAGCAESRLISIDQDGHPEFSGRFGFKAVGYAIQYVVSLDLLTPKCQPPIVFPSKKKFIFSLQGIPEKLGDRRAVVMAKRVQLPITGGPSCPLRGEQPVFTFSQKAQFVRNRHIQLVLSLSTALHPPAHISI